MDLLLVDCARILDGPIYNNKPRLARNGRFPQPFENLDRFWVRPVVEDIPKQEDVRAANRLRREEIVRLNRDLAVRDRLGLVEVPVLLVHPQYMRLDN